MESVGHGWRILFVVLFVALILAIVEFLIPVASILLVLFAGILFGIFINAIAAAISRRTTVPYIWCYAVVVTVLILGIAGGCYFMGSHITGQASLLWSELKSVWSGQVGGMLEAEWAETYLPEKDEIQQMFLEADGIFPQVMTVGQWFVWGLTALIVVFFVGIYTAYHPSLYETGLIKLLPQERRSRAGEVLLKVRRTLIRWMIGRFLSMAVIGVLTSLGLWLLGVPLAITLGVLAALLTFIPNIGPILAAVPQVLLALNVGTDTALYVIVFNLALQGIESYLLTPLIQRYEVTLPPALTIMVQLLMTVVLGVIGIMMAAPLTAALMVVVQTLYIQDRLGDPSPGELAERD